MRIALVVLNCLQRNGLELWYAILHSIARIMRQNNARLRETFLNLAKKYYLVLDSNFNLLKRQANINDSLFVILL